ncbi:hypothetical protein DFJ77DRAFT_510181 [Powellomyces hirtus]|nr:hypothetical protein DFJ77DRAFT_510181 [Powellomyces hirtus]
MLAKARDNRAKRAISPTALKPACFKVRNKTSTPSQCNPKDITFKLESMSLDRSAMDEMFPGMRKDDEDTEGDDDDDDNTMVVEDENAGVFCDFMPGEDEVNRPREYWREKAIGAYKALQNAYSMGQENYDFSRWSATMYQWDACSSRWGTIGPVLCYIHPRTDIAVLVINLTYSKKTLCLNMRVPEYFSTDRFVRMSGTKEITFSTIQHNSILRSDAGGEMMLLGEYYGGFYGGPGQVEVYNHQLRPVKDPGVKTVRLKFQAFPAIDSHTEESAEAACRSFRQALTKGAAHNRQLNYNKRLLSFAHTMLSSHPLIEGIAGSGYAFDPYNTSCDAGIACTFCGSAGDPSEGVYHYENCVFLDDMYLHWSGTL